VDIVVVTNDAIRNAAFSDVPRIRED